jgi:hypothetical protein
VGLMFEPKPATLPPVALNCANGAYPSDNTYTVDCLQGAAWDYLNINDTFDIFHGGTLAQLSNPEDPSPGVTALPQSLSQNTLLTGSTHYVRRRLYHWS